MNRRHENITGASDIGAKRGSRYFCVLIGLVALMASGCSEHEPFSLEEIVRYGYWHTDGAQEICQQGVCAYVYANFEIMPDSACAFEIRRTNHDYSEVESITCRATIGQNSATLHHTAQVTLPNVSYVMEAAYMVAADDPEWNVMRWQDLRLIRR